MSSFQVCSQVFEIQHSSPPLIHGILFQDQKMPETADSAKPYVTLCSILYKHTHDKVQFINHTQ